MQYSNRLVKVMIGFLILVSSSICGICHETFTRLFVHVDIMRNIGFITLGNNRSINDNYVYNYSLKLLLPPGAPFKEFHPRGHSSLSLVQCTLRLRFHNLFVPFMCRA